MKTGYFLMGRHLHHEEVQRSLAGKLLDASAGLEQNLFAIFSDADMEWHRLEVFYDEVFFPYMIGGIVPGIIAGLIAYYISVPLIRAYQHRRKGVLKAKFSALKKKPHLKADARSKRD